MTTKSARSAVQSVSRDLLTHADLLQLLRQIEEAQNLLFTSTQSEKKVLEKLPQVVVDSLPADATESQKSLDEWLKQLARDLQKFPVVTVTISYIPTFMQASELIDLVQSGFENHVVVDVRTDARILAGARIEFENKRVQYSLQDDLEQLWMEAQKEEFSLVDKGADV